MSYPSARSSSLAPDALHGSGALLCLDGRGCASPRRAPAGPTRRVGRGAAGVRVGRRRSSDRTATARQAATCRTRGSYCRRRAATARPPRGAGPSGGRRIAQAAGRSEARRRELVSRSSGCRTGYRTGRRGGRGSREWSAGRRCGRSDSAPGRREVRVAPSPAPCRRASPLRPTPCAGPAYPRPSASAAIPCSRPHPDPPCDRLRVRRPQRRGLRADRDHPRRLLHRRRLYPAPDET